MHTLMRALLGGLLAAAVTAGPAAAETKIGVFDAQAVSENTELGKRIQTQLSAFTDKKETEIKALQEQVSEMRKQLSQQSLSLSADKRTELEKGVQRKLVELQSFQEAANRELELEYGAATREFRDKLVVAIEAFGKEEGFGLILDRSQVAWATTAIDVTAAIVDRFNKMFPVAAE
jgi:outer membrane protein